ncbi:MAG: PKD domain-containing protein [Haliscomenobacteraceae bacterium CHB4]|nr:PKD domain-containing protein [Haliscomenobacteraceae bacterium CHB4]
MSKLLPIIALLTLSNFLNAQTFTATGGAIPDDGSIIVFSLTVSGLPATVDTQTFGLESVCLNAAHTWDSDLSVSLRSPDGKVIPLFSGIGGDLDGFVNTCLSGNAATSIYEAPYPFTGTFRPFGDMGVLNNGQDPNGTWQLVILDTYAYADAGILFDWSITFGAQPCKPFPFSSSDLPIIRISTGGQPIPNEPKIDAQMEVIDNGPGQRNYLSQTDYAFAGPIGVELHGNSTQGFPKKSLRLETRDSLGDDLDVSLLGLPESSDYVLSANFSDKTLMRNALAYDLSRRLGQYASRTRFCEVVVDNTYQGVYLLTEKIKRGKNHVDIPKLSEADTTGVALTGGYIVKIDWNSSPGWTSPFSQPNSPNIYTYFQHEYPQWDEMHPAQTGYIRRYVDSFEVALAGAEFQDALSGWRRFADEKSFLDFLYVNEMSRNVDGYRLSTYFHKQRDDKGGKLRMGPVWDFDLAWYNADYCNNWLTAGWAFDINYVCPDAGVPFWWERLMQDTLYTQNLACRWQSLRASTLRTDSIFGAIDSMAAVVQEAQARNFQYWPILGVYVWPNPGALPDTYAGEVQKMKNWIADRLDWLDFSFETFLPALDAGFSASPSGALDWQFTPAVANDAYTYAWDFDDGTTSAEMAPQHQFPGPGTYAVQLTVSTAYGCSSTTQQIIHIVNTGTDEVAAGALRVFPNPAAESVTLLLPEDFSPNVTVRLVNALGETASEQQHTGGGKQIHLNIRDLPSGVYSVVVEGPEKRLPARVVVQH